MMLPAAVGKYPGVVNLMSLFPSGYVRRFKTKVFSIVPE
jgi:hypothetical protein